jgi:hypothetical protein
VIPRTITGAKRALDVLERGLDTRTPVQLALIARTADAIKLLFWDAVHVRERALDVSLSAAARLKTTGRRGPS